MAWHLGCCRPVMTGGGISSRPCPSTPLVYVLPCSIHAPRLCPCLDSSQCTCKRLECEAVRLACIGRHGIDKPWIDVLFHGPYIMASFAGLLPAIQGPARMFRKCLSVSPSCLSLCSDFDMARDACHDATGLLGQQVPNAANNSCM